MYICCKSITLIRIGIIREEKIPTDNRVPFTPLQCVFIQKQFPQCEIIVQPSTLRCFADQEYIENGIKVQEDVSACDYLFGIKEVQVSSILEEKTYFIFSHTKKKQPHNQKLLHTFLQKKCTLIDYECLTLDDGKRIVGFGHWAGIIGAYNGLLAYLKKIQFATWQPVHAFKDYAELKNNYPSLSLPPIKIAVTGSGNVAKGILETLQLLGVKQVSENDFMQVQYTYPVFVHLFGKALYGRMEDSDYERNDFHHYPEKYCCTFLHYAPQADLLMNGVYWDKNIPRLFEQHDIASPQFNIKTIADITCDENGSVPCNLGSSTIVNPTYGVEKNTGKKIAPFINNNLTIDIMAVDNLPNELPRDASDYFGALLIKNILPLILENKVNDTLNNATICNKGELTPHYTYLEEYAKGVIESA